MKPTINKIPGFKKTFFSVLIICIYLSNLYGQQPPIELVFSAQTNKYNDVLDSILIENHTQWSDTILYAPDTVLLIDIGTGIDNEFYYSRGFEISQNQPNPIKGQTEFFITILNNAEVFVVISDLTGRELLNYRKTLSSGKHLFVFKPGPENFYLLTAFINNQRKTLKMINNPGYSFNAGNCLLEYAGKKEIIPQYKSSNNKSDFVFSPGDLLIYTGYSDTSERKISDRPLDNQYYVFQFIGDPCPGKPYVWDIDGNVYNTVQIGSQCWMKENLKTTTYNNGTPLPNVPDSSWADINSGAYVWYNNDPGLSYAYGALYNAYAGGSICPEGWMIPDAFQFEDLEDFVAQQFNHEGVALKACRQLNYDWGMCNATEHPRWAEHSTVHGIDVYGFSGLPGGTRFPDGSFDQLGQYGYWWSSSTFGYNNQVFRYLLYYTNDFHSFDYDRHHGFSVRCLKIPTTND